MRRRAETPRTVDKTDAQWREELTPEQFRVLREAGTERAFTGPFWHTHDDGVYHCAACDAVLFDAATKFDSGTGWPSFTEPAVAAAIELRSDCRMIVKRTEVVCRACGGHLGHVFNDGPREAGGKRYCINGAALSFDER